MVINLILVAAILAAVAVLAGKRWRQRQRRETRTGASIYNPIAVSRFDEIDAEIALRRCWVCEGAVKESGETSRNVGERRFRIVRLICNDCDRDDVVFFEVTAAFH